MPGNRTQNLTTLLEKRRKLDADIAARKTALTKSAGAPFVAKLGDNFSSKDAAMLAELMALHGPEKSITLLSRYGSYGCRSRRGKAPCRSYHYQH